MKVHCARGARTIAAVYPSEDDTLVAWCGRASDTERSLSSVVRHTEWDFIPPTATCGRCERSIGAPMRVSAGTITAIEAALIGIAKVFGQ